MIENPKLKKSELIIAESGKCLSGIILPEEPNVIEVFAKEEAIHYFELMTSGNQSKEKKHEKEVPVIRFVRKNAGKKLWYPDTDCFDITYFTPAQIVKLVDTKSRSPVFSFQM